MATVDITINDRIYKVTCDDGQENRLRLLATEADQRVRFVADELGQIGDSRLMLLAMLMVCDELYELRERTQTGNAATDTVQHHGASFSTPAPNQSVDNGNTMLTDALRDATTRIDELTRRLDSPR